MWNWANKVFKTKPNRKIPEEIKQQVKTIFHHLTKEKLVNKILSNYLAESSK